MHRDAFRVFTPDKVLRVLYTVTTDPRRAVELCQAHGLSRAALDEMDEREADALYFASQLGQVQA